MSCDASSWAASFKWKPSLDSFKQIQRHLGIDTGFLMQLYSILIYLVIFQLETHFWLWIGPHWLHVCLRFTNNNRFIRVTWLWIGLHWYCCIFLIHKKNWLIGVIKLQLWHYVFDSLKRTSSDESFWSNWTTLAVLYVFTCCQLRQPNRNMSDYYFTEHSGSHSLSEHTYKSMW